MLFRIAFFTLGFSSFAVTAIAESVNGNTIVHDGGSVSLQVAASADADGILRGALFFDNKPGWKTYWRDPGASGIPPGLEVSWGGVSMPSKISFPPPVWIDDGYGAYAGYIDDVSLPVEIDLSGSMDDTMADFPISAWFFAGVCREVCIPVMGTFTISSEGGLLETSLDDIAAINTAFDDLPKIVATKDLVQDVKSEAGKGWLVTLNLAHEATPEDIALFASAERDGDVVTSLAPPELVIHQTGQATWRIRASKDMPENPVDLHLTLSAGSEHVETWVPAKDMPKN